MIARRNLLSLILAAAAALTWPAWGQPAPPGAPAPIEPASPNPPLSLEACLKLALSQNPLLEAARQGIRFTEEGIGLARASYYPEVTLDASYRRWESHAFIPDLPIPTVPDTIGPVNDWSGRLGARYLLFDSGARTARLRAALAKSHEAAGQLDQVRLDLVLETKQAFYGLVAAQEAVKSARQQLARAEELLALAEKRKAVGDVPQADVVRMRVEVADARLAVVRTTSLAAVRTGALNMVMGLPADTRLTIAPPLDDLAAEPDRNVAQSMNFAEGARPELQSARERVAAAGAGVREAKSAYGPTVALSGSAGWRDEEFFPEDSDWSIGVGISWTVFDGFARNRRVGQSRAEEARQQAMLDSLILQVRQEVWQSDKKVAEAFAALASADALLADAAESLRLVKARYENGAATASDLLSVQASLARAEAILVESRMDCRTALAAWDRARGVPFEPQP